MYLVMVLVIATDTRVDAFQLYQVPLLARIKFNPRMYEKP